MIQYIHQPEGRQEICDLLVLRVTQEADVRFEVAQDDRLPNWEAFQRLLQVLQMI